MNIFIFFNRANFCKEIYMYIIYKWPRPSSSINSWNLRCSFEWTKLFQSNICSYFNDIGKISICQRFYYRISFLNFNTFKARKMKRQIPRNNYTTLPTLRFSIDKYFYCDKIENSNRVIYFIVMYFYILNAICLETRIV